MSIAPRLVDRTIEFAGCRVRVRDEGAGPVVLFLHGWALDSDQWWSQAEELTAAWRIVRIDRVGYGASSGAPSVENDVRALEAVVDALGLERFALVAASAAGRAALRYALARPERLDALVLDGVPLEGFHPGPRADEAVPLAALAALREREGMGAVRAALAALPFFRLHGDDRRSHAALATMLARYPGSDLLDAGASGGAVPNVAARLDELRMPVLVVTGEFESAHRRLTADALAYGLPRARRAIIEGAGHLAALDRPCRYGAAVYPFLSAHLAS